jgi:hypothetical protein
MRAVVLRGDAQRRRVGASDRRQLLADGVGQDPPPVRRRAERQAAHDRLVEHLRIAGDRPHELAVEQRRRRDRGEASAIAGIGGDRLVKDRAGRVGRAVAGAGDLGDRQPVRCARDAASAAATVHPPLCAVHPPRVVRGDRQPEPLAAQRERLLGGERQIGGTQRHARRTAHARQLRPEQARQQDDPLGRRHGHRQPLDHRGRLGVGVLDVIDHDDDALGGRPVDEHVERADRILAAGRQRGRQVAEPGGSDGRPEACDEQLRGDATGFQEYPDRQRRPRVDQLGGEHRLAVAATRLDHDHPLVQAGLHETRARHVMPRQTMVLQSVRGSGHAPSILRVNVTCARW